MELLIVIGVLGILAAGLLAAIDPFEQLKKARDTNNRSATIELMSSFTRYYANHGAFPWNMTTTAATSCARTGSGGALDTLGALGSSVMEIHDMEDCINESLVVDGELKTTFFDGIGSTRIYVASDELDPTNLVVCFAPEGKATRTDASSKYLLDIAGSTTIVDQSTADPALCPNVALATCLQCFK